MKNKNRVKTLLKIEVGVFRSSFPKVKKCIWGTQEVSCQICFEPWIWKRKNRISISSLPTIKPSFLGKSATKNAKQTTTRVTRVEGTHVFNVGGTLKGTFVNKRPENGHNPRHPNTEKVFGPQKWPFFFPNDGLFPSHRPNGSKTH